MSDSSNDWPNTGLTLPALFVGHGNPMNAIEDNAFSQEWAAIGRSLPRPKAILCISAHWETFGTRITAMERPQTIHDFGGFPPALFEVTYPAPGSPDLARWLFENIETPITLDFDWGLDHGTWSILCRMFPKADVPVLQLSLDRNLSPSGHYALGQDLRKLRDKGILIVGSGNIVHNLSKAVWQDAAHDWATAFDGEIRDLIVAGDHEAIIHLNMSRQNAGLAVPSPEHFLPLLYILALQKPGESVTFFSEKVTLGSIAMRSLVIGTPPIRF